MTSFQIFHSWTIFVYSIGHTGFLLRLGRFQHCNLGAFGWRTQVQTGSWGFYFHVAVFSRETFQTLAWKFLLCVLQKVVGVYIFPNFVLVQLIVVQKLVKTNPRRLNKFCFFYIICKWHVIVQTYRNKKLNILIITCQSKEKNTN